MSLPWGPPTPIGIVLSGGLFFLSFGFLLLHLRVAKARNWGQPIRDQGPQSHQVKDGTPTAAGWAFLPAFIAFALLVEPSGSPIGGIMLPILYSGITLFLVGLGDDIQKLRTGTGLLARYRLPFQLIIGGYLGATLLPDWGWGGILAGAVILGASVNGVNFTDGADGLLASTLMGTFVGVTAAAVLFAPTLANDDTAWRILPLGLLLLAWFPLNRHPAKLFMGESGSYLLGAWMGILALLVLQVQPFLALGLLAIPLLELASVVIQVGSFRLTGKRPFKMAPFHHHLEKSNWSEPRIAWTFGLTQFALSFVLAGWRV